MFVEKVEPRHWKVLDHMYSTGLLQKGLKLQGIQTKGMKKDEMIAKMQERITAKPKEEEGEGEEDDVAETSGKRKSPDEADKITSSSSKKQQVVSGTDA